MSIVRAYTECNMRQRAKWKDAQCTHRYAGTVRDIMSTVRCGVVVMIAMHASAEAVAVVEVVESLRV